MRGEIVGSYRLDRKLGEGGMGMVYRATHTVLGKLAAVKLMRPQLCADEESVARFFNEAVLTASIRHPGIVEIFDYGFHEASGSAFISMALLEGESLETRLEQRQRLPPVESLRIAQQIASALAAAHDAGVVHRDLKPDNVFLTPDPDLPGGERIQLLDFGIAKLLGDDNQASSLTQTGTMIGTPLYMSPEQCRGRSDLDGRTDLYAIGCMLYRMLSGVPPFTGATPLEVAAGHLRDEPKPLRKRVRGLPQAVADLVGELLAKSPDERPASAAVLHRRLGKLLATLDTVRGGATPAPVTISATAEDPSAAIGDAATLSTGAGGRSRSRLPWAAAIIGAAGLAAGLFAVHATRGGDTALAFAGELPTRCGDLEPDRCRRAAASLATGEIGLLDRGAAEEMLRDACAGGELDACNDVVALDRRYLLPPRLAPHIGDPSAPVRAHLVIDFGDLHLRDTISAAWGPLNERFPGKLSLTLLPAARDRPSSLPAAQAACATHRQRGFFQFAHIHEMTGSQLWSSTVLRSMTWPRGTDVDRLVADFETDCEHEVNELRTTLYELSVNTGTLIVAGHPIEPPYNLELVGHFIEQYIAEATGPRELRISASQRPVQSIIRYAVPADGPPRPITMVIVCDPGRQTCESITEIAVVEAKTADARIDRHIVAYGDNDLPARTLCAARRLGAGETVGRVLENALRDPPLRTAAVRAAAREAGADWPALVAARDGPCVSDVRRATRRFLDSGAPTEVRVFVNGRPTRIIGTPTLAVIREELALAELFGYGDRIEPDRYYRWLIDNFPR